ncbi:hypothetical protein AVEN_236634-1, partial [Araneus ventricosus]
TTLRALPAQNYYKEVRPVIDDNTVNKLHHHYCATTGTENLLIYEKASYPRAGRCGLGLGVF